MAAPLKDLIDRDLVADLAQRIKAVDPSFDAGQFTTAVMSQLPDLELKPRIEALAREVARGLGDDYRTSLETVVEVAKAEPALDGFAAWSLCTFVELFGVDHPQASLPAMEHLTKRASCEFAIRPFLREHWNLAYAQLEAFTGHEDEAVRRLPSEGTRPKLPWGANVDRLTQQPEAGLALLERLRHDPSETVRRSVANHLNDVAKTRPDLVVATTARWAAESPPVDQRLISHALRTLVKQGEPGALGVLGFTTKPKVRVETFTVTPDRVGMGQHIELTATVRSTSQRAQRLVVDFVIHHVNKKGATSPKVFKWTTIDLKPGQTRTLSKRRLIAQASTRTYYSGRHRVELQIAGQSSAETDFRLDV